jgi:RNA polymerase sigma factor (sigma-70 family)
MNANDAAYLERWIHHREPDAFREIVTRYAGMVYAAARRVLGGADGAEDIAQECFQTLATAEKVPSSYLAPWLHRVATNLALKRIRTDVRRHAREEGYAAAQPQTVSPRWDDIYEFVDEAIAALPDDLRESVVAHYLEGYSQKEIAQALDIPRQTLTNRIHKGIDEIRKTLRRRGIEVGGAALGTLFAANLAEAATVPPTLLASMGKIALSGAQSLGSGTATAPVATAISAKWVIAFVATLVVAFLTVWVLPNAFDTESTETPVSELVRSEGSAEVAAENESPSLGAAAEEPDGATATVQQVASTSALQGSVSGRVFDAQTDSPIVAAYMLLRRSDDDGEKPPLTQTDENGEFRFDGLPLGTYKLGYAVLGLREPPASEAKTILLTPEVSAAHVDFPIVMGPHLHGRVVDSEGQPVLKAMVFGVQNLGKSSGPIVQDLSASDGTFDLYFGHQPEQVKLFAGTHPDLGAQRDRLASEIVGPFYPNEDGTPEIEIKLHTTATISGIVLDTDGTPVSNARVIPRGENAVEGTAMWESAETREDGSFELPGLPEGSYDLDLDPPDTDRFIRVLPPNDRIDVAWGETKSGLQLVLDLGISISGHVYDRAGQPIADAYVRGGGSYARTNADGSYQLTGLTLGRYEISARHDEYVDNKIPQAAAGSSGIDFTLERRGAIEGQVIDASTGQPIERFRITHFPEPYTPFYPGWERDMKEQSDGNGAFRIANVTPGTAKIVVQAEGYLQADVDVDQVLPAQTVKNVVVRIQSGLTLEGRVVDTNGRPVSNVGIIPSTARPGFPIPPTITTRTGDDGTFVLTGLSEETMTIGAYCPGYAPTVESVSVTPGRSSRVTITLLSGATIQGTLYVDGLPSPGKIVHLYASEQIGDAQQTTTTSSGSYHFAQVSPGEVSVLATLDGDLAQPLTQYRTLSQRAIVSDGQSLTLDFHYTAGSASVEGLVTDVGEPIASAQVTLLVGTSSGQEEQFIETLNPEDNGYFQFAAVPAGSAQLIVTEHVDYNTRRSFFDVGNGEAVTKDTEFAEGRAAIQARVSGLQPEEKVMLVAIRGDVEVGDSESLSEVLRRYGLQTAGRKTTSENGDCDWYGLEPGRYTIISAVSTGVSGAILVDATTPFTLIPIKVDGEATQVIDIAAQ